MGLPTIHIDGTILDIFYGIIKALEKEGGKPKKTDYAHIDIIERTLGIKSSKEFFNKHPEVWIDAPFYTDTKEFLYNITKHPEISKNYMFATNTANFDDAKVKYKHLEKLGPDLGVNLKHRLVASKKKHRLFRENDIVVDDNIHVLRAARKQGAVAICVKRRWNEDWDGIRVELAEVYKIVEEFYEKLNKK